MSLAIRLLSLGPIWRARAKINLIDTKVKSDTTKGYLYINEVCKMQYSSIFNKKIQENSGKLGFTIDEDFGLVLIHEFFWEYDEFKSFHKEELEEATGDIRRSEEKRAQHCLKDLSSKPLLG
jgi:Zn-finger domain-containing protein